MGTVVPLFAPRIVVATAWEEYALLARQQTFDPQLRADAAHQQRLAAAKAKFDDLYRHMERVR
jgi:hypothetical protein